MIFFHLFVLNDLDHELDHGDDLKLDLDHENDLKLDLDHGHELDHKLDHDFDPEINLILSLIFWYLFIGDASTK